MPRAASVVGKSINLTEPQIVNGLQTSESVFRHFREGGSDPQKRTLLVKIIVSQDDVTRDAIIRSTNNQTNVELASLHATDKVQRDIEEFLRRDGLFFERRKNHYVDQGHHPRDIVTPMYLAGGFVCLVLKSPRTACNLKSRFMRDSACYEVVFSEDHLIQIWPAIARVMRLVDEVLESKRPRGSGKGERFLKSWRQLTGLLSVARLFSKFSFSQAELGSLDLSKFTEPLVRESWDLIRHEGGEFLFPGLSTNGSFITRICRLASTRFGLDAWQVVERQSPFAVETLLTDEIEMRINAELPAQPWKPGVHRRVASALAFSPELVSAAIASLIAKGVRKEQIDGVVYSQSGEIVAVDPDRTRK